MLSDKTIRRLLVQDRIQIKTPSGVSLFDQQFQSCSVDLRLGLIRPIGKTPVSGYVLQPNEFALASTMEWIGLPNNIVGKIEGKSSRAREALLVECAGLVDPGFKGEITLELKNLSPDRPIMLNRGMFICQITYDRLDEECWRPYGHPDLNSHYQGQEGPTPSWTSER